MGGRRIELAAGPTPAQAANGAFGTLKKEVKKEAVCFGADGEGDGKKVEVGGWVFDEDFLREKGDWDDLLESHL